MPHPVDPTTTDAWRELTDARDDLEPDLRGWFAADPDRARRLSLDAGDLHVDLSKNLVDDRILAELVRLGEQVGLI